MAAIVDRHVADALRRATTTFPQERILQQPFIARALDHEMIAFGEVHGIREAPRLFCQVARVLAERASTVLVLLERDFLAQDAVSRFVDGETIDLDAVLHFSGDPRNAGELAGPRDFIHALRHLNTNSRCAFSIACIDIAHNPDDYPEAISGADPRIAVSRDTLAIRDEDIFDAAREQFMFQEAAKAIERSPADRILFCGGNGHVCLSSSYFDRDGTPELHIPTLVGRIARDLHRRTHAVHFLPVSGRTRYQQAGQLRLKSLPPIKQDPVFSTLASIDRQAGWMSYTDLSALPASLTTLALHRQSWQGILTLSAVSPDEGVR